MRLTSPVISILLVFSIAIEEARAQEVFRFDIVGPDQLFVHDDDAHDAHDDDDEDDDEEDEDEIASNFFALLDPPDDLGAEAWCIGLQADGGAIARISFDDTSVPHFMKRGGFVSNEITKGIGNEGAVSCVVLSPMGSSTLPPGKTKKILKIKFESAAGPSCKEAALRCVDGLITAKGHVVDNTVTEGGVTRPAEKGLKRFQIAPMGGNCLQPNNDEGWIHASAWNFLFPLTNPYGCSGGGPQNMLRAWAGGEELFKAAPQAGDEWPLIAYQVADAVTGFEATHFFSELGLGDEAIWSSLEWLAAHTENFIQPPGACDPPAHLDCPAVDYQAILDRLNELAATLGIARISSDNTLAVAQTYVRNRTETPVCVNVCFASDDSGQVRVNGRVVINRSACRGLAEDCEDTGTVFLEPGVNQISVFTWEGEGDWGFRLALLDEAGQKMTSSNQEIVEFLGTTPEGGLPPSSRPRVTREVVDPSVNPLTVRLTATGLPAGGSLAVRELYVSDAALDVSEVSNGGSLAFIEGGLEIVWNVEASILSTGITYRLHLPPGATVEPVGTVNGCDRVATAAGARVLHGAWPRTELLGLIEDSQDIGAAGRFTGGPGELSFAPGPDGEPRTPDDEYVMKGSGDDIGDTGDAFRFAYLGWAGDFQCTVRVKTRVFPTSGGRFGRYGLMVRRDTSPASKFSLVRANLEADPGPQSDHPRGDNVAWQFRRSHGSAAPTSEAGFVFPDPDGDGPEILNQPNWFRLVRRGPLFSGYASFDGVTWKLVGSDTWYGLNPNDRLLVGLMYSRHSSASEAGTITFTDFSIGPLPPPRRFFENDENLPGSTIFRADFDGIPDGELPGGIFANCGDSCAFTPRVFGGRLRLSQEGQASNAASAFLDVQVPFDAASITIEYTLFASHSGVTTRPPSGDPNPGDGITFALVAGTHTNLVGTAGSGLGYDGLTRRFDAAKPSFAVEADTWAGTFFNEGTGSPGNDGAWHLGINSGGNTNCVALNAASTLPDLFAPEGVRHRVVYTPDGKVSVFILPHGEGIGAGPPPEGTPEAETQVEPLSSQGDSTGTLGFTAGTGDSTQTSEVDDIEVIVVPCSDSSERAVVAGPATAKPGSLVMLDASASDAGADDSSELPSLVFRWSVTGDAVIEGPSDGPTVLLRMSDIVGDGEAIGRVEVDDLRCTTPVSATQDHPIAIRKDNWVSYDTNSDGGVNISDPVFHLNFLFSGGLEPACDETTDYDGDGETNITDPVACLNFLFASNGRPPARGEGCQSHASCGEGVGCQ